MHYFLYLLISYNSKPILFQSTFFEVYNLPLLTNQICIKNVHLFKINFYFKTFIFYEQMELLFVSDCITSIYATLVIVCIFKIN